MNLLLDTHIALWWLADDPSIVFPSEHPRYRSTVLGANRGQLTQFPQTPPPTRLRGPVPPLP
jgi:hypothetical protein